MILIFDNIKVSSGLKLNKKLPSNPMNMKVTMFVIIPIVTIETETNDNTYAKIAANIIPIQVNQVNEVVLLNIILPKIYPEIPIILPIIGP